MRWWSQWLSSFCVVRCLFLLKKSFSYVYPDMLNFAINQQGWEQISWFLINPDHCYYVAIWSHDHQQKIWSSRSRLSSWSRPTSSSTTKASSSHRTAGSLFDHWCFLSVNHCIVIWSLEFLIHQPLHCCNFVWQIPDLLLLIPWCWLYN